MQSLYNKQDILETFVDQNPFHAICISESWLSPAKLDLISITGYKIASSYCRVNYAGGSVCILLPENTEFIERKDFEKFSVEYVIELCAVELYNENILLISVYWNGREKDIFNRQLKLLLTHINNNYRHCNVVLGGDFNINVLVNDTQSNDLLNVMLEYNFAQHVRKPTRLTKCIDLIFTNFQNSISHTDVMDFGFSDHKGAIINLKISNVKHVTQWFTEKRLMNAENVTKFKKQLKEINWIECIKPNNNIQQNYKNFIEKVTIILNRCIPKNRVKLRTKFKKHWLTVGIRASCKHKRLLKILINKSNNTLLNNHYKAYEKLLKRTIITSKKLNYVRKLNMSENKVKTMWSIINERTNKKPKKDKENIKLQIDNNLVTEPKEIVNSFNNHFASIGEEKIRLANGKLPEGRPCLIPTENSFYLSPVTYKEIHKIIKNMKNKRSFGIDELPPTLIKECADELILPITTLINQTFEEGDFPDLLKISILKPVHKKDEKMDPNNYRPIALLPAISKIFEKCMCDRVYSFCEKFNLFDECQNGFRKNRSTTLAVQKYIQEIINTLDNKKYAVGILLDMTKAYDTVQYNILLNKLYGIGIRGKAHQWFQAYLKNRQQYVEIEHYNEETKFIESIRSNKKAINFSIPQGSVIGCLLFLIYINDLPKVINQNCVLFADDISLLTTCDSDFNLTAKLTSILNIVTDWMLDHNLQINYSKTKIMAFYPHQKKPLAINLTYNNMSIQTVNEFNLLGIDIDTHVNWKNHIQKIHMKLSRFCYALREIKESTDFSSALAMYYAYAYAWLSYGVTLWGNSVDAPRLFTMQKKLIRIIFNLKQTDSCRPFFQKHKLLTLPSIYILELCKFVRKYNHFFNRREQMNQKNLRHKNRLHLPYSRLKLHSSSPYIMAIKVYNKLPKSLTNEPKDSIFFKKLKLMLINKSYYTLLDYLSDSLQK